MKSLLLRCLVFEVLLNVGWQVDCLAEFESFSSVKIEEQFSPFFRANQLLMELAGARIIKFDDGSKLLMAVGCTDVRDNSPKEQLRRITVCRAKAQGAFAAEQSGVKVSTCAKFTEKTLVSVANGEEKGVSLSESMEMTESEAKAIIPGLPVIGTWMSKDGKMFYLAIGKIIAPAK